MKCKTCGVEISSGDICHACFIIEIMERKKLQGVKVTEVTPKQKDVITRH